MRVPKSFSQITVEQYQEILPLYLKDKEGIDTWINIIAILTDKQVEDIEAITLGDQYYGGWILRKLKIKLRKSKGLINIIKSLGWLVKSDFKAVKKKYLWVNGNLHKATLKADNFNTAQYVEVKTFLSRGDAVAEMHHLLATIYSPLTLKGFKHDGTKHAERAKAFKKAKVGDVYPTVFFYSKVCRNLIKDIMDSGINQAMKQMKEADQLLILTMTENLESIGDGIVL